MIKSILLSAILSTMITAGIALAPNAAFADDMKKDTMKKEDSMSKDTMKKDTMKKEDSMSKDTMKKDEMKK